MKKRIIPCLDIQNGRVVKGKKFQNMQDVEDPLTLATQYEHDQADELFILDISGKDRRDFLSLITHISKNVAIPITVGGGIKTINDITAVLDAGAQKVSITSAAIEDPQLLKDAANQYGSSRIVLSIDAKKVSDKTWHAFTNGGKKDSGLDIIDWAQKGESLGAGEILLNSIDADGIKGGYDLELKTAINQAVQIPVIASGGAGTMTHFKDVLTKGHANAALAASVFHYGEINIINLKKYLLQFGITVKEI